MDQICLDSQDKLPPTPHPLNTLSTKHSPPTGQKSACSPPRIISGTALTKGLIDKGMHMNPIILYCKPAYVKPEPSVASSAGSFVANLDQSGWKVHDKIFQMF